MQRGQMRLDGGQRGDLLVWKILVWMWSSEVAQIVLPVAVRIA